MTFVCCTHKRTSDESNEIANSITASMSQESWVHRIKSGARYARISAKQYCLASFLLLFLSQFHSQVFGDYLRSSFSTFLFLFSRRALLLLISLTLCDAFFLTRLLQCFALFRFAVWYRNDNKESSRKQSAKEVHRLDIVGDFALTLAHGEDVVAAVWPFFSYSEIMFTIIAFNCLFRTFRSFVLSLLFCFSVAREFDRTKCARFAIAIVVLPISHLFFRCLFSLWIVSFIFGGFYDLHRSKFIAIERRSEDRILLFFSSWDF